MIRRFCAGGAGSGNAPRATGHTLVYGGGNVGLMGGGSRCRDAAGGKRHRCDSRSSANKELAHNGLTKLHVVLSMHERKHQMASLADGFCVACGIGTLEEIH